MKSPKSVVLDLLQQELKINNLAKKTFESLFKKELKQKYGSSGKTCGQAFKEYKKHRAEVENATVWIKNI